MRECVSFAVESFFFDKKIYEIVHLLEFLDFKRFFGRYFSKNSNCLVLIAPLRFDLIKSTASSYDIPSSMSANATITGALRENKKDALIDANPVICSIKVRRPSSCDSNPSFNSRISHKIDHKPAETSHAMDCYTRVWRLFESIFQ